MARWEVRSSERSVEVDGPNWMMAIGGAMDQLGIDGMELSCLICDIQQGGVVRIYDPRQDTALLVRRVDGPEVALLPAQSAPAEPATPDHAPPDSTREPALDAPAHDAPAQTVDPALLDAPEPSLAPLAPPTDQSADDEPEPLAAELSSPGVAETPAGVVAVQSEQGDTTPADDGQDFAQEEADFAQEEADFAQEEADFAREEASSEVVPPSDLPAFDMPTPSLGSWTDDVAAFEEPSGRFNDDDLAFILGPTTPVSEPPPGLAEALFEATFDIAGAEEPSEAADAALGVLLQHVPAESAAVLFAGINDVGLRFLAVRGPSSDQVRDLVVPFDEGIAGFVHNRGADLIIQNASADPRHLGEVDEKTGYTTGSMLVAALRDDDGDVHGCLELLNPPGRFEAWHLDAARSVAKTLAEYLGRRS